VIELLDDVEHPISTSAVRMILTARGRAVTAEQLGRLAAYQREDFQRTRMPPPLCWALNPDGSAVTPRWWARGHWRLLRRLKTDDVVPIWWATLAVRLCWEIAKQPGEPALELATLARGAASLALEAGQVFDLPTSKQEWMDLYAAVYARHYGALNNQTGGTSQQYEAEKALNKGPAFDSLFGREAGKTSA
jgi:hypothetical protein